MSRILFPIVLLALSANVICADDDLVAMVPQDEAQRWACYLTPLPKSLNIDGKRDVNPADVLIEPPTISDYLTNQACQELRECMSIPAGSSPKNPSFVITLQLGGPEAQALTKLKNSDQAYTILPNADRKGLRLVALTSRGLYYACKTLQQLIKAKATPIKLSIPILAVTDWPDLEDRGLWGSDSHLHLRWLGDRKINTVSQIADIRVDLNGQCHGDVKAGREMLKTEAYLYAIKHVPTILHMEQISSKGIFAAYPQLKAQGGAEGVICYSRPEIVDILACWIVALGKLPHVETVDLWLTENLTGKGGCRCPECSKQNRDVLEARVVVAAFNKARQTLPKLTLRVLTSEETYKSNKLIFQALPPDIKVWYYHSLLTYNTGETPIINQEVEAFARSGHWIGVCPSLGSSVRFGHPFTCAPFIRYRMNEFVDKGLLGLIGYATPGVRQLSYNVEAMAEWSWNAKGRTPREFALSYAVRSGMQNPEKFVEWAEAYAPLAWDVYGSEWPTCEKRKTPGPAAEILRKGTLPELGSVTGGVYRGPWADIKSPQQLDGDVAAINTAVILAKALDKPEYLQESLIVQGYMHTLKALYELKQLVENGQVTPQDQEAARRYFRMYDDGFNQAKASLVNWYSIIMPGKEEIAVETVDFLQARQQQMQALAQSLGCW